MSIPSSSGGAMEYTGVALTLPQIFFMVGMLRNLRRHLRPPLFFTVIAILTSLWLVAAYALWLTWSGKLYSGYLTLPSVQIRVVAVAIGYSWMVASALLLAIYATVEYLNAKVAEGAHSEQRRRFLIAGASAAAAVPIAAAGYGVFIERSDYQVTEIDLPVAGLHPDLEGIKIAQLSDLHVSPFLSVRDAARVVDLTNSLRPHLTVFTGDLTTERGDPLDAAIAELGRLRADAGVLACHGNHEYYVGSIPHLTTEAARRGVFFLHYEARQLRFGSGVLNVAGCNYETMANRRYYLNGTERLIVPGAANLMLQHNPDAFEAAADKGFHAMLAGHTHGGQVNFEILHANLNPARFRTKYVKGLYSFHGARCYVTTGIGTIGIPVRLGAPPEVALLRLRRA